MPFQKIGRERLSAVVNVRMTAEEKVELRHDAELCGLTVSQIARRFIFGRRVEAMTVYVVIKELRRIVVLLRQILKDKAADPKLVEAAVTTAVDAIKRVVR
ncbi:MobB mobilization protein [Microvirga sp. VF16]|uniref:plasmid mobilization protein n=1 Tax=Microvirga sp. VF16 TaxID=2807101 RepID=UPI00193E2D05|nr:MobB mobilization protein [Microvirga sp. VF16]QRM35858.1 MobB mobilization protein [Microvirga sp. VF16]